MKTHHKPIPIDKDVLAFDVVCGMEIDKQQTHHHTQYRGEVYYFCSSHCRQHFEDNPTRYVGEN
ncbi:MAG TPA: YHS domain-containing protein [Candidatus Saccharimonadales bacterium]|nr:YHS domain-containing protein [Candidatus Saccharimonadales bacterium]